jgi:hypothetical protein
VGVGSAFENGNTSFFVEVPTSNTFFRLLCLTERIFTTGPSFQFADQVQNRRVAAPFIAFWLSKSHFTISVPSRYRLST